MKIALENLSESRGQSRESAQTEGLEKLKSELEND